MPRGSVAEGATTSERPSEESVSAPRAGLFVAVSSFQIANGTTAAVKQAFLERPHLVDEAPGFIRMDVISPVDAPHEIWLLTYWTDETSYRAWHKSHHYRDSHRGIPKGTKLVPKSATVRFFEHVAS